MEIRTDPWKDLAAPSTSASLSARRVDAQSPWGFFWARGSDKRCILALEHSADASRHRALPVLRGIECLLTVEETDGRRLLCLKLVDSSLQDVFLRLCLDIIASGREATCESEVVARTIARTWRWHHLLRGGMDSHLSAEEQKGLIGELMVLEALIMPVLSARDAISSWHGPLGAPKDFEIGRTAIEAKARRGSGKPYIAISSEYQLDRSGTDALFLHVAELDKAIAGSENSFTLTDIADRIRNIIRAADPAANDLFEALLGAAGFRWEDDYSDMLWVHGPDRLYHVGDEFPSVTAAHLRLGVSRVTYSIALQECEPFSVDMHDVTTAIIGENYGN